MKATTFVPPTSTSTVAAGNWKDSSAYLFVSFDSPTQTLSRILPPPVPDLIDALAAFETAEDELDAHAAVSALADPAERPTIPWEQLRGRQR